MRAVTGGSFRAGLSFCSLVWLLSTSFLEAQALSTAELDLISTENTASFHFGAEPRSEAGQVILSLLPGRFSPRGKESHLLSLLGLTWWISPNLAVTGRFGSRSTGSDIFQVSAAGLRYLPEILRIGPFTPEILILQDRLETTPYTMKWMEARWIYSMTTGNWILTLDYTSSTMKLFTNKSEVFVGTPSRLESNTDSLVLTAGYHPTSGIRLSPFIVLGRTVIQPGFLISVVI